MNSNHNKRRMSLESKTTIAAANRRQRSLASSVQPQHAECEAVFGFLFRRYYQRPDQPTSDSEHLKDWPFLHRCMIEY